MIIMIFDTETTDLQKYPIELHNIEDQPHIIQFSYILYDIEKDKIIKTLNEYIKISPTIQIKELITNLTGITNEICYQKGKLIENIINTFFSDLQNVELIVGHNITFDINMIIIELLRMVKNISKCNKTESEYMNLIETIKEKKTHCTMKTNIDYCAIICKNRYGREYYKYPKLSELHDKMFKYIPSDLHNSLCDVLICLKCYLYLVQIGRDISEEYNTEISQLYNSIFHSK